MAKKDRRGIKEGENLRSDSEGWTEATSTTNGLSPVGGSLRSLETKVVISNEVLCRCKSAMPQKVLPALSTTAADSQLPATISFPVTAGAFRYACDFPGCEKRFMTRIARNKHRERLHGFRNYAVQSSRSRLGKHLRGPMITLISRKRKNSQAVSRCRLRPARCDCQCWKISSFWNLKKHSGKYSTTPPASRGKLDQFVHRAYKAYKLALCVICGVRLYDADQFKEHMLSHVDVIYKWHGKGTTSICFDKLKENAANPRKDWTWMELKQAARLLSRMKLIKDPPKLATNALFALSHFQRSLDLSEMNDWFVPNWRAVRAPVLGASRFYVLFQIPSPNASGSDRSNVSYGFFLADIDSAKLLLSGRDGWQWSSLPKHRIKGHYLGTSADLGQVVRGLLRVATKQNYRLKTGSYIFGAHNRVPYLDRSHDYKRRPDGSIKYMTMMVDGHIFLPDNWDNLQFEFFHFMKMGFFANLEVSAEIAVNANAVPLQLHPVPYVLNRAPIILPFVKDWENYVYPLGYNFNLAHFRNLSMPFVAPVCGRLSLETWPTRVNRDSTRRLSCDDYKRFRQILGGTGAVFFPGRLSEPEDELPPTQGLQELADMLSDLSVEISVAAGRKVSAQRFKRS